MSASLARKLAEEFISVLKYNPQLSHDDKVLSLELRLDKLVEDVEKACAEAYKRSHDNAVIVDERPSDIPVLAEAMIRQQQTRGPAN